MKTKLVLFVLLALPLVAQNTPTTTCDYNSNAVSCLFTAGVRILPGQLVKVVANGQYQSILPVLAMDGTSVNVLGVADNEAPYAGASFRVRISGMGQILVDGNCSIGNSLTPSTTTDGYAHCVSPGTTSSIGT